MAELWLSVAGEALTRDAAESGIGLRRSKDPGDTVLESGGISRLRISRFHRRHPQARDRPLLIPRVYRAGDAAELFNQWTAGATIVGVVPHFDAECLADMFAGHGMEPAWNDDLVDVVPLATAAIRAAGREPASDIASLSTRRYNLLP